VPAISGGSPDHVESHAQRILDVGNLLAGGSMKSRVLPFHHPLDQFRRDEPLPEKQGQRSVKERTNFLCIRGFPPPAVSGRMGV
jgi:hypothetical protein